MARKPRIHYPGSYYHVILRGNGGQDIFFSKYDRTKFYLLLQEGTERFDHRIEAPSCKLLGIFLRKEDDFIKCARSPRGKPQGMHSLIVFMHSV